MGGLIFTGLTLGRDARAKEVANSFAFAERHRSLWSEAVNRHELHRIVAEHADLSAEPITPAEEIFLNMVIVHHELGWRMAKSMNKNLKPLKMDVAKFYSLPLPRAVWEKTKNSRNQKFAIFVEKAIKSSRSKPHFLRHLLTVLIS